MKSKINEKLIFSVYYFLGKVYERIIYGVFYLVWFFVKIVFVFNIVRGNVFLNEGLKI